MFTFPFPCSDSPYSGIQTFENFLPFTYQDFSHWPVGFMVLALFFFWHKNQVQITQLILLYIYCTFQNTYKSNQKLLNQLQYVFIYNNKSNKNYSITLSGYFYITYRSNIKSTTYVIIQFQIKCAQFKKQYYQIRFNNIQSEVNKAKFLYILYQGKTKKSLKSEHFQIFFSKNNNNNIQSEVNTAQNLYICYIKKNQKNISKQSENLYIFFRLF
eukprot:TRINITY_DN13484_c1_g2_i2.p1 TRINITY_DN13484_c1_g2~~TRINITY_DN13484_c1_g2_i2.p1  ORF type:complete len:214 (-),score=-16.25 TRINITY_DN13484_c1_g2_i2:516-1157(-)